MLGRNQSQIIEVPEGSGRGWWRLILVTLTGVVILPVVLGWKLADRAAEFPITWRAVKSRVPLVVAAAAVLAVALAARMGLLPEPWSLRGLGLWIAVVWVLLLPVGLAAARLRLRRIATEVHNGTLKPEVAPIVRAAINTAAVLEAQHAAKLPPAPSVVAEVVQDDARGRITRFRDSRDKDFRHESKWVTGRQLVLPDSPPRVALLGGSGSGKTTAAETIVHQALNGGMRVVVLDCKGDRCDAEAMLGHAESLGLRWRHWPTSPFHAWLGDSSSVVANALQLLPQDSPQHYLIQAEGVLSSLASQGPWRTTGELLARLEAPERWLSRGDLGDFTRGPRGGSPIETVRTSIRQALRRLGDSVDGGSGEWTWDDEALDLVVASIDLGQAGNRAAALMMLADLNSYRIQRRPEGARPLLVVLDEAAALLDDPQAPDLALLTEQVRSQGIGLIIAAQSETGLGLQGQRMLESGIDILAGRMANPDLTVRIAGSRSRQATAHEASGDVTLGASSASEKTAFYVEPERLRRARAGVFMLAESGQPPVFAAFHMIKARPVTLDPVPRDDVAPTGELPSVANVPVGEEAPDVPLPEVSADASLLEELFRDGPVANELKEGQAEDAHESASGRVDVSSSDGQRQDQFLDV